MHAGKLGQVTDFRPTIVGSTAKHCIYQYMVLFHYCSLWGNTAMPGGLHVRLCHAFLVDCELQSCMLCCLAVHFVGGLVFIIFALSAFIIEPDDHE